VEQEMLTLPEHLISPRLFIEVHVVLSVCLIISCDSLVFLILSFELFLLFDCFVSIFFTCLGIRISIFVGRTFKNIDSIIELSLHSSNYIQKNTSSISKTGDQYIDNTVTSQLSSDLSVLKFSM